MCVCLSMCTKYRSWDMKQSCEVESRIKDVSVVTVHLLCDTGAKRYVVFLST